VIRAVVGGASGKLGSIVCRMIFGSDDIVLTGAVVSPGSAMAGKELYGVTASVPRDIPKLLENADVSVDLTSPDAAGENLSALAESNVNVIVGTTAVGTDAIESLISSVKKNGTSALISSNFAIGVNIFWKVSGILAEMLSEYDIEIIEAHHGGKKDAPSGTANETLRRIRNATGIDSVSYGRSGTAVRGKEIGMHSIRAGSIVGEHTVLFAKDGEIIEIKHTAISRETFASGCLECIRWINGKKDGIVHGMEDVV